MREIEIELVHRRRRSHRPMRVMRWDMSDELVVDRWMEHVYRSPTTLSPWSSLDAGWLWSHGGWLDPRPWDGEQPTAWAYEVQFRDGTRGVCRVRDLNEALAELGARVDRRGDAQR